MQQDSRPNLHPSEREKNPLPIHLELLHAFIPIDQFTLEVSAITATTSSVDLACALNAHIQKEKPIAEIDASHATINGKITEPTFEIKKLGN